jgi:hypothetical protein
MPESVPTFFGKGVLPMSFHGCWQSFLRLDGHRPNACSPAVELARPGCAKPGRCHVRNRTIGSGVYQLSPM